MWSLNPLGLPMGQGQPNRVLSRLAPSALTSKVSSRPHAVSWGGGATGVCSPRPAWVILSFLQKGAASKFGGGATGLQKVFLISAVLSPSPKGSSPKNTRSTKSSPTQEEMLSLSLGA